MMQDRHEEAHEVLKRLHRTPGDEHDMLARKEYIQMAEQLKLDREINATTSRWELFKTPANRKRALVGFVLMWNNQFTGGVYCFDFPYDIADPCPSTHHR